MKFNSEYLKPHTVIAFNLTFSEILQSSKVRTMFRINRIENSGPILPKIKTKEGKKQRNKEL